MEGEGINYANKGKGWRGERITYANEGKGWRGEEIIYVSDTPNKRSHLSLNFNQSVNQTSCLHRGITDSQICTNWFTSYWMLTPNQPNRVTPAQTGTKTAMACCS